MNTNAVVIDKSLIGTHIDRNLISELVGSGKLKLKDVSGNVRLYNAEYVETDASMYRYRSVIVEHDDNGICVNVFVGLPYPIEYDETNFAVQLDMSDCYVTESREGTVIRAFYADGKWFTSTNRKLDAFKSKWAAKRDTFGMRFVKAVREYLPPSVNADDDNVALANFYDAMGRDKQHMFLLRANEEERIVCDAADASGREIVEHIGSFSFDNINSDGIRRRLDSQLFVDATDVAEYVATRIDIRQSQGVIVICRTTGLVYKVMSSEYNKLAEARGNVPSLKFRYLMLRQKGSEDNTHMYNFLRLYPQMCVERKVIEEQIYDICCRLHRMYIEMYVKGNKTITPKPEESVALRQVHAEFLKTRQITTQFRINDILSAGNPSVINKLLNLTKQEAEAVLANTASVNVGVAVQQG